MIFRSPYPDVSIPDLPLTPFVLRQAGRLPNKPALIDGVSRQILTYSQLADGVKRTATGLAAHGFGKGEVFAISTPNCPEFAIALHAVLSLGGIVTPANPLQTADELASQLNDAGATYLLTVPDSLERLAPGIARSKVREVFTIGEAPGATPFATLLDHGNDPPQVTIDPRHDLALLPYSSGTTGLPKGVMLTHANLVANLAQVMASEPISERDTLIGILPLFHIFGMTVVMNFGLAMGATIVTLPRFNLEQFLQTLELYRVTYAYVVPPIILALAKQPVVEHYDLSNLRCLMSGAAPLSAELATSCRQRLGCAVKQGYGLTEASPVSHINPPDPDRIKLASIGPLVAGTEGRVVDPETGAELGPGAQGEIRIRGPQVMKGYLHRPEQTAAMLDADGWLRTGDLGCADEDGYFYVLDRLKELIKVKGFQVAPAELEGILLTHPAVADAAVIPSPDEDAGEVPKAFIVLRTAATPEDLMTFVAERVAPYMKVRRLEFVEQIPKSPSGKILRRVLVERERTGALDRG